MEWKDNKYDSNNSFKCQDKLFNLNPPLVMGVLNITPDSFFEGSRNPFFDDAIRHANEMIDSGVDIIDIGGISTRPDADLLTKDDEIKRVIPVIKEIRKNHPKVLLSIDTFRADVAQTAVDSGVDIINDVYGGRYDENMFKTVAKLDVPYILMHSRGFAKDMQNVCEYEDVVAAVCFELSLPIYELRLLGVKDIIIDPGFGFSKTLDQNYQLLNGLSILKSLGCPILIGVSRKSMIYKFFNNAPSDSLTGTIVLNTVGLLNNASIIRVHDVKEAIETRKLIFKLKEQQNEFE